MTVQQRSEPGFPTVAQMITHLNRYVRGQFAAKKALCTAVYKHDVMQARYPTSSAESGRYHTLLIGPTGCGKTYMVKLLAEFLGVPVSFNSATSLVEAGYRGTSVDSLTSKLLDQANGDPRLAERGIVIIDEIDKLKVMELGDMRDVGGEGVQQSLLTMLDGRIADSCDNTSHEPFDTGRVLFIACGAFVGLDQRSSQERPATRLGFTSDSQPRTSQTVATDGTEPDQLIAYGLIPELVGRFTTVVRLSALTIDDLHELLTLENTALVRAVEFMAIHGITLVFTPACLRRIATQASQAGTGVRGMNRIIAMLLNDVESRVIELSEMGVRKITIHEQCLIRGADADLDYHDHITIPPADEELRHRSAGRSATTSPKKIIDVSKWSEQEVENDLERIKETLGWKTTTRAAAMWWTAFERENSTRLPLVHRLAQELRVRGATIEEFFEAYVGSNTDNIQANLFYLDYIRLKREHEAKKKNGESGVTPPHKKAD